MKKNILKYSTACILALVLGLSTQAEVKPYFNAIFHPNEDVECVKVTHNTSSKSNKFKANGLRRKAPSLPSTEPMTETDLTKAMFHKWTSGDANATQTTDNTTPAFKLLEPTDMVYGYSTVDYNCFADLSAYQTLSVTLTGATPRFLLNRDVNEGAAPDHLINIPDNNDQKMAYQTSVNNDDGSVTYYIDLAKIVADKGYAHLHAIKSYGNITVSSMKLYTKLFSLAEGKINPNIHETGKYTYDASTGVGTLYLGQYGFGGWRNADGFDVSKYESITVTFAEAPTSETVLRMFTQNDYWNGKYVEESCGNKTSATIDVSNIDKIYIAGFWNYGNAAVDGVYNYVNHPIKIKSITAALKPVEEVDNPDDAIIDNIIPEPTYGDATPQTTPKLRRPINNRNPMWLIHVDVWNQADPQKIIDLIPDDIKPYVVMNLSLSCAYNTGLGVYERPQDAIKTYKSWGSVCQQNKMWFTCQPASGGHTHIMDDDLETYEYFFKNYPNFLGWNFAEQFWGFNVVGDKSSTTEETRIALFAKLIPMHYKYGGFLTISFCGMESSHALNPIGMLKRNADLLKASKDYPESIIWLYKYTHPKDFYNNESVTFGTFVAGLSKNYGVRYDNCGYNDALTHVFPQSQFPNFWRKKSYSDGYEIDDTKLKYPTAAGIGTVMEQMCQNGGAIWDGPELIWTEDFQNLNTTQVDGYTQRNWGTFPGFRNIWIDMFRKVIDGTFYIPTQKEVQAKTKIAIVNDVTSGSNEDKYATWADLYDNLYKVDDPLNTTFVNNNVGKGQFDNNLSYQKSSGRYGTIPMMPELYSSDAKAIPTQVKKSQRTTVWPNLNTKKAAFDAAYPIVSTGDLFVSRYKNQLVTYNPYSNLGKTATDKRSASGHVPLRYNTCKSMDLTWANYSSAIVKEYSDKIYFYLNNYRTDTITPVVDKIVINGASAMPTYNMVKRVDAAATATESWNNSVYTLEISHMGPVDLTINCSGASTEGRWTNTVAESHLPTPVQPAEFVGTIIKEAEDMNYKNVQACIDNYFYQDNTIRGHAGNGIMKMGTKTNGGLTTNVKTNSTGAYNVTVRYSNTDKAGNINLTVGSTTKQLALETTAVNEWKKATIAFDFTKGSNTFKLDNVNGINIWVDQVIFTPAEYEAEVYDVVLRNADEGGSITADKDKATEGSIVTLTVTPPDGYVLDGWAMGKTKVDITKNAGGTYSFVMPDNVVTIEPVFKDASIVYELDIASTVNSSMPIGWRATDGTDVHQYPNNYGSGPRIFSSLTGKYNYALYWRNLGGAYASADYGNINGYPLTLKKGKYKLTYRVAAWNGSPKYKAQILSGDGDVINTTNDITAAPNASGNDKADLSACEEKTLEFEITEEGNYVINFTTSKGGEFLLLECRINAVDVAEDHVFAQAGSGPSDCDYYISGAGDFDETVAPALADVNATVIDVQGYTGQEEKSFASANPNCLVIYKSGAKVKDVNSRNMVKDAENAYMIRLVDGYEFRSPFNISCDAGSTYTRTLGAGKTMGTMALPFSLDVSKNNVPVHVLSKVNDETITFAEVKTGTLPAGTVILYNNKNGGETQLIGGDIATTPSGLNITAAGVDGWYTAQSFKNRTIEDVTIDPELKDYDVYGITGNEFVQATKTVVISPFRAFFLHKKSSTGSSAKARLSIYITDDTPSDVLEVKGVATELEHYNAAGQRINADSKGLHIFRMSDGTTRKVLVR